MCSYKSYPKQCKGPIALEDLLCSEEWQKSDEENIKYEEKSDIVKDEKKRTKNGVNRKKTVQQRCMTRKIKLNEKVLQFLQGRKMNGRKEAKDLKNPANTFMARRFINEEFCGSKSKVGGKTPVEKLIDSGETAKESGCMDKVICGTTAKELKNSNRALLNVKLRSSKVGTKRRNEDESNGCDKNESKMFNAHEKGICIRDAVHEDGRSIEGFCKTNDIAYISKNVSRIEIEKVMKSVNNEEREEKSGPTKNYMTRYKKEKSRNDRDGGNLIEEGVHGTVQKRKSTGREATGNSSCRKKLKPDEETESKSNDEQKMCTRNALKSPYFSRRYESTIKENIEFAMTDGSSNSNDLSMHESWDHDYSKDGGIVKHKNAHVTCTSDSEATRLVPSKVFLSELAMKRETTKEADLELASLQRGDNNQDLHSASSFNGEDGKEPPGELCEDIVNKEIIESYEKAKKELRMKKLEEQLSSGSHVVPCQKCGFIWFGRRSFKKQNKCKNCENRSYPSTLESFDYNQASFGNASPDENSVRKDESPGIGSNFQQNTPKMTHDFASRKEVLLAALKLSKRHLIPGFQDPQGIFCLKKNEGLLEREKNVQYTNKFRLNCEKFSSLSSYSISTLRTYSKRKTCQLRRLGICRVARCDGKGFRKQDIIMPRFNIYQNRRSTRIASREKSFDAESECVEKKTMINKGKSGRTSSSCSSSIIQRRITLQRPRKNFEQSGRRLIKKEFQKLNVVKTGGKDAETSVSNRDKIIDSTGGLRARITTATSFQRNQRSLHKFNDDNDGQSEQGPNLSNGGKHENGKEIKNQGKHRGVVYNPPKSPFGLIQEKLFNDPWRLLVGTIFLNKTAGKVAVPILWKFFELWPDPETTMHADRKEISSM